MIEVRGLTKFYGEQAAVSDLSFTVRPGIVTVWVPEILSSSCDLGVFVDQAAEPVPPQNPDISPWDWRVPA
jgi:ABC-type phosphonate transport system ATPase subunit